MLGENIYRDSWIYALAAHEYYWGDGQNQIISDQEYDALTKILQYGWDDIPNELQLLFRSTVLLGQGATQIKLNTDQLSRANLIYEDYKKGLVS